MSRIPTQMRAAVLTGPRQIEVQQRAVPTLDADQVLVEVASVGVCGSDVHFYADGRLGTWTVDSPLVLGHESGGRIVAVGSGVDSHRIGQRVSIEPQRPTTTSAETLRGSYNLDPQMEFYAVPGTDGAFQEYVAIQGHFAFPVPDHVSDDAAALMEPLSVAIATCRKARIEVGSRVLIAGGGPIGLICAQAAKAYGATDVIVTDISAQRREVALKLGVTSVLDPVAEGIGGLNLGVDVFVDASGAASAVQNGIKNVRPEGRVILVGMGLDEVPLPVPVIQNSELWVTGVFRYNNTWPTAVTMVSSGMVDLDALVTGHYRLAETEAALNSTIQPSTLKSVVRPQD